LEFQEIGFSGRSPFYARVSIKYSDVIDSSDASSLKIEKMPLDLVCVLDVSGSMSGSRIANLQQAMEFVIDSLSANDRLSIVTFNHQAVMAQGFVFMGGAEATAAKALIASLLSGGGTDIFAGMRSGAAVLSGRADRNPCSCMFLLTDGQDGSNIPEKLALAEELRVSGTSLFTFGFGADHDSDQMSKIGTNFLKIIFTFCQTSILIYSLLPLKAQAAEGSFIFVESNDTIVDAFGGAIGSLQGQGLSDVTLTISSAPAVSILDASCGRYRTTKAADGQSVAIAFANLYAGESREVLVALGVPPITDSTIERVGTYPLIGIKATYRTDSGSDSDLIAIPESVVTVRRVLDAQLDPTVKANQAVEVQRLGKDITAVIIEARKHADDGGFDKAKQVLSTARDVLKASNSYTAGQQVAVGLEMDINTALSQVSDGAAYNSRGGRAEMADICSTLGAQRKVYSKAGSSRTFQTSSSSAYQTVATNSKFR